MPARRGWWGAVALVAYVLCFLGVNFYFLFYMQLFNPATTMSTASDFVINNIAIAADLALCPLIAWVFFRQGIGWLVSVTGRFRWRWFGEVVGVFTVGYVILSGVVIALEGTAGYGFTTLSMQPYTWVLLASIVLTTPFQCAGEEFQARALLPRLIAAIVPVKGLGVALSALVPSVVFMFLHDAQDPWLNLNYFCVALMMWWLAYRTGGIEASIALHLVNNLFSEWYEPFSDISGMFDRSAGTGSPDVLINLGAQLIMVVVIDILARRHGLVRLSAPGAVESVVVKPRGWVLRRAELPQPATAAELVPFDTLAALPAPQLATPYWPGFYPPPRPSRQFNYLGILALSAGIGCWIAIVTEVVANTGSPDLATLGLGFGDFLIGAAIAFGAAGIDAARHKEASNLGMAVAGVVIAGALVLLVVLLLVLALLIGTV